jgi:hypothetical protein
MKLLAHNTPHWRVGTRLLLVLVLLVLLWPMMTVVRCQRLSLHYLHRDYSFCSLAHHNASVQQPLYFWTSMTADVFDKGQLSSNSQVA